MQWVNNLLHPAGGVAGDAVVRHHPPHAGKVGNEAGDIADGEIDDMASGRIDTSNRQRCPTGADWKRD